MPPDLPKEFPIRREIDHKIDLIPGSMPLAHPPYRMSLLELAAERNQLSKLLEDRLIQPSKASYGTVILLYKKYHRILHMCVNYSA